MAVDKLVDSTQLDADLTSVANAIRTKGGTSAQLAFPQGFVDAIDAIETGGGGDARLLHFETFVPTERYYNGNYLYKNLVPSGNCAVAVYSAERPEADASYAQALMWSSLQINRPDMSYSGGTGYIVRSNGTQGTDGNQCTFTKDTGVLRLGSNYSSFLPGVEYIIIQVDMEVPE